MLTCHVSSILSLVKSKAKEQGQQRKVIIQRTESKVSQSTVAKKAEIPLLTLP